jgi:hypothetical protein
MQLEVLLSWQLPWLNAKAQAASAAWRAEGAMLAKRRQILPN